MAESTIKSKAIVKVGDISTSSGWTCPSDGFVLCMGIATNADGYRYWYIADMTDNTTYVMCMGSAIASGYQQTNIFYAQAGHQYKTTMQSSNWISLTTTYYKFN